MATDVKADMELEIAHVLFIDTVGYSKLLINQQRELLEELNRVVRDSNRFRAAESAGKLIRLPTGDGMALVFADTPEAPVECALEIGRVVKDRPHLPLRMGIHSGPVSRVVDVNDRLNAAGAGINIAQRVMSCGDAGHILLSKHTADDLVEYARWQPFLHDIGECEVKHGTRVGLVNFYGSEVGNSELPVRCKQSSELNATRRNGKFLRWPALSLTGAAIVIIILLMLALYKFLSPKNGSLMAQRQVLQTVSPAVPEKSIAVLPFDNLSDNKEDVYFADGVHDEVLTGLAKVREIRVISRTSVMAFRNSARRNLREIARGLAVAYILEGTVQRSGSHVRIRTQLIDARTDIHVWGEAYNGDLADVFALESELAQKIVFQLKSKLSATEKTSIEEHPTTDLAAYDLYLRAKILIASAVFDTRRKESLEEAVRLLNEAVVRDPTFHLAYYQLAHAHDQLYFSDVDHTPSRLKLANEAVQAVERLRPGSGEAHLALAKHLYWGNIDIIRARQELVEARELIPNDPLPLLLIAYIDRRQGRWEDSIRGMERALEFDPRNVAILRQLSLTYESLRQYSTAAALLDRAFPFSPSDVTIRVWRAGIDLKWRADTKPLHSAIETIVAENASAAATIADQWMELAIYERDGDAATRAFAAAPGNGCQLPSPRAYCEGIVAELNGDKLAARGAFSAARLALQKVVGDQPDYAEAIKELGMLDAMLGYKEDAIREGKLALDLMPVSKDAILGPEFVRGLAVIYAWTGEKDLAFEQLEIAVRLPGYLSYGDLRLHSDWDLLRGDPRFEKIVESLAPANAVP
jgi:TolB-like protein/Flp pilus assembly protein TadD